MESDSALADQVSRIRSDLVVSRIHNSHTVRTFGSFHEEFSYLFTRFEGLPYLPLFWRRRGIQANMVVKDASGTLLPTLPSATLERFVGEIIRQEAERYLASIPEARREAAGAVLRDLHKLAVFGTPPDVIEAIIDRAEELEPPETTNKAFQGVMDLALRLERCYLPFAVAPAQLARGYLEIRQSVDLNIELKKPYSSQPEDAPIGFQLPVYTIWQLLRFVAIGRVDFEMPIPVAAGAAPPWARTDSIHLQLNLPVGTRPAGPPEALPANLFEGTGINDRAGGSEDYVYTYLTGNEARTVWDRIGAARDELFAAQRTFDAVEKLVDALLKRTSVRARLKGKSEAQSVPSLETAERVYSDTIAAVKRLGVAGKAFAKARRPRLQVKASVISGVRLLTALLWVVVGFAYGIDLAGAFNLDRYLSLFAAFLFAVLGITVFSLDKPYLRHMVSSHVLAATTVFFELLLLRRLV
jgi:hypothetical protein